MNYKRIISLAQQAMNIDSQLNVIYQMHGKYNLNTFDKDIADLKRELQTITKKIFNETRVD